MIINESVILSLDDIKVTTPYDSRKQYLTFRFSMTYKHSESILDQHFVNSFTRVSDRNLEYNTRNGLKEFKKKCLAIVNQELKKGGFDGEFFGISYIVKTRDYSVKISERKWRLSYSAIQINNNGKGVSQNIETRITGSVDIDNKYIDELCELLPKKDEK